MEAQRTLIPLKKLAALWMNCKAKGCGITVEIPLNRHASAENLVKNWPCEHAPSPQEAETIVGLLKQLADLRGLGLDSVDLQLAAEE